jgi:hypothetical protein
VHGNFLHPSGQRMRIGRMCDLPRSNKTKNQNVQHTKSIVIDLCHADFRAFDRIEWQAQSQTRQTGMRLG